MLNTKEVINPLEKYMQSHMLAIAEPHECITTKMMILLEGDYSWLNNTTSRA